jgi:hypothetical protein
LTAGAESFDQPILIHNPFDEPLQIREVFTTEDFMSLKGMPPLLSSSSSQLSSTMLTKDGEQDHSSDDSTMLKEDSSISLSAAATNRPTTSQSVTNAGQSVWTIGECS